MNLSVWDFIIVGIIIFINNGMATRAHSSLEPTQHGVSRASSMHRKSIDESAVSKVFSRNMSQSSLKNFVDIDRLIGEIKIAPRQHQQQT